MSEQNKESFYQKQRMVRPKIEDAIGDLLDGDKLKIALAFIAYLRENKLTPQWASGNSWKVSYKNYTVCYIRACDGIHFNYNLEAGSWHIQPFIGEYDASSLSDEFKEIVWSNKKSCCGGCSVRLNTILGKVYNENACEKSIVFDNPDVNEIECIKKLLEMRKNAIKEGKAKKHIYIAKKH